MVKKKTDKKFTCFYVKIRYARCLQPTSSVDIRDTEKDRKRVTTIDLYIGLTTLSSLVISGYLTEDFY